MCSDSVAFGVSEKDGLKEGWRDAEPVSLYDSDMGMSTDTVKLSLRERDSQVLTDAVRSDEKDAGGTRVAVVGPTRDCEAVRLNEAVPLKGADTVGMRRADAVGWRLLVTEGIVENVRDFVSSAVEVGAGDTVAVS